MSEWKEYKLGEIVLDVAMGPFGSNLKADNFISTGVPVIRGSNLNNGGFEDDKFVFVSDEKAKSLKRSLAYPDELIFTHRGTLGQVAIIPKDKHPYYLVSQSQMRVDVNREFLVPRYLLYWFKSRTGQYELLKNSAQVGVPSIASPTKSMKEIDIRIPTTSTQNHIVEILSSLDDKIELNNKINKELENLAQTLFKQWFIDFEFPDENGEPYQSSGGEMVESELAMIPKGWEVKRFNEFVNCFDNKRVPISSMQRNLRQGKYPYYGAASLMDFIDDYLFDGIYVLMGEDGSVTDAKGYPVLQYISGKFWVNNHAHVIQGTLISTELVMCLLRTTNISHLVTGAVQPKLNQGNMNKISIPIPNDILLLDSIEQNINDIFESVRLNTIENQELTNLRDTLLPKLISGEINVKDL